MTFHTYRVFVSAIPVAIALTCGLGLSRAAAASPSPQGAPLTRLSLEDLGNLEVTTVSKAPEEVRRTAAAIHVITQDDIRRSGATTLPELLRLAPGVDVARIDTTHWSVGVRGFGDQFSKSVLLLIDGRSVYTPLFAGVFWAMQDTMIEDIERIEVIRGPGGTIWGSNAVNGVINIVTKTAGETPGVAASISTGNVDHAIAAARFGGGNGRGFDYRVYGKAFRRGPQEHSDGTDFDDWTMGQTGFRADWSRPREAFTLQGDVVVGEVGQSVALGSFDPPSQVTLFDPIEVSGGNVLARWSRDSENDGRVEIQSYYDVARFWGPQLGELRHTFDVDFTHELAPYKSNRLTYGAGLRVSPSRITQRAAGLDVTPHDLTDTIGSLFVQDELSLADDRVKVTAGAKLEHLPSVGLEVQPSARLMWIPTERQSYWTAVTRAVRTPSRLERGFELSGFLAADPLTYVRITGNDEFRSEKLVGVEAGMRSLIAPQFHVDVAVFRNRHDDLAALGTPSLEIEMEPAPPHVLLIFPYANGVQGTSYGGEITASWQPSNRWQTRASYSHLRFDLENIPGNADVGSTATYVGSSPRHQVELQSLITLPGDLELDQRYRFVSALPAREVPRYHSLDLRLGWRMTSGIEWSVAGHDLTDSSHLEFAHDPGPIVAIRRSVVVSLTWRR